MYYTLQTRIIDFSCRLLPSPASIDATPLASYSFNRVFYINRYLQRMLVCGLSGMSKVTNKLVVVRRKEEQERRKVACYLDVKQKACGT